MEESVTLGDFCKMEESVTLGDFCKMEESVPLGDFCKMEESVPLGDFISNFFKTEEPDFEVTEVTAATPLPSAQENLCDFFQNGESGNEVTEVTPVTLPPPAQVTSTTPSPYAHAHIKLKCAYCDKVFDGAAKLLKHSLRHVTISQLKCSICDKALPSRESFLVHTRRHTGEKPFKCPVCPSAFASRDYLRKHFGVHVNAPKAFKCDICPFATKKKQSLRRHFNTVHTDRERPFKCPHCPKAFHLDSFLQWHLPQCANNHGTVPKVSKCRKPFACSTCGMKFLHKGPLAKHQLTHWSKVTKKSKSQDKGSESLVKVPESLGKVPDSLGNGSESFGKVPESIGSGSESFLKVLKSVRNGSESFGKVPNSVRNISESSAKVPKSLGKGSQSQGKVPESLGNGSESLGKIPDLLGKDLESLEYGSESLRKVPDLVGKVPESLGNGSESLRMIPESLGKVPESLGNASESLGKVPDLLGKGSQSLGNGSESAGNQPAPHSARLDEIQVVFISKPISPSVILNRTVHPQYRRLQRPHKCNQCDRAFVKESDFRWHLRMHHKIALEGPTTTKQWNPSRESFECQFCDKKFLAKGALDRHEMTHEQDTDSDNGSGDEALGQHSEGHPVLPVDLINTSLPLQYKCPHCTKAFLARGPLETHARIVHSDERPFKCPICQVGFRWWWSMYRHQKSHQKEILKKAVVPWQHNSDGPPIQHNSKGPPAQHNSEGPSTQTIKGLKCPQCDKTLQGKKRLENHLRLHSDERPFKCPTCYVGFKTKWTLNRHQNEHEKELRITDDQTEMSVCAIEPIKTEPEYILPNLIDNDL